MCTLRKRTVRSVAEAVDAFLDNKKRKVLMEEKTRDPGSVAFIGSSIEEVEEEAHIFFDSGCEAIVVTPLR